MRRITLWLDLGCRRSRLVRVVLRALREPPSVRSRGRLRRERRRRGRRRSQRAGAGAAALRTERAASRTRRAPPQAEEQALRDAILGIAEDDDASLDARLERYREAVRGRAAPSAPRRVVRASRRC